MEIFFFAVPSPIFLISLKPCFCRIGPKSRWPGMAAKAWHWAKRFEEKMLSAKLLRSAKLCDCFKHSSALSLISPSWVGISKTMHESQCMNLELTHGFFIYYNYRAHHRERDFTFHHNVLQSSQMIPMFKQSTENFSRIESLWWVFLFPHVLHWLRR